MASSPKSRRRLSPEEKPAKVRPRFVGKEAVSAICDELRFHPNLFYRWQTELFEHGSRAFESTEVTHHARKLKRLGNGREEPAKRIGHKVEVIAGITADYHR